ncbi:MAG: SpoIIE family protein phosphatase [Spirochaetales bacterium]|nr:SpoIIE family protein phosphatase [Spirochaetales bacterium]
MANEQILIVEDDFIFAQTVKEYLLSFGYEVTGIVSTGEQAIKKAKQLGPDLIIMDIHLEGDMDGIDAATIIMEKCGIPVVYLTAYADQNFLDRAKQTDPLGYIVKPLQETTLKTTIELAMYKAKKEKKLRQNKTWLTSILQSMGEGVVVFTGNGEIVFCNNGAEEILQTKKHNILGKNIKNLLTIFHHHTHVKVDLTSDCRIFECNKISGENYILDYKEKQIPVDFSIIPVKMVDPTFEGYILALQDITDRKKFGKELQKEIDSAYEMQKSILPENDKVIAGIHLYSFLQPCTFGAGDLYNFFTINDDYAGFYVLDVMGHGIPATITSLILYRLLTPHKKEGELLIKNGKEPYPPSKVLDELNKQFHHEKNNQYFTIIYGLYEIKTGKVKAAGGGHNFPILQKANGDIQIIRTEGSILGFFIDLGLTEVEFTFEKGDRLFLYTDGLIDCLNGNNELFSQKRLISVINEYKSESLKILTSSLESGILRWRGKNQLDDDISFFALEKN